jgi:regulator of sigma E protease
MFEMPTAYNLLIALDPGRIWSIMLMLIFISILIIAHEMGHFWVARWCGIKVERFGFGLPFGPTLWSKKIGDVEYCLHACLFGGYVSFPDDDPENPLPQDSPVRFENKPLWARFAVMVAGVTVNAFLGWFIMTGVILGWGVTDTEAAVGRAAEGQTAYQAGLVSGDRIIKVNGIPITGDSGQERTEMLSKELGKYKGQSIPVTFLRPYAKSGSLLYADIQPEKAQSFAEKMNLQKTKQNESEIEQAKKLAKMQADMVVLNRQPAYEKEMTVTVTPNENGKIGISLAMIKVPVGNPLEASVRSAQYLSNTIRLQFVAFGEMFQGKMNVKDLSGPISLVNVGSNQIEKNGIQSGLMLTAIISTILAVMNVLPIPALDGGHIFFLIIEALKGSPVKQEIREQVTQFGFLGLLGLIAFVLLNDINNTFINPVKLP